jgi:hypothetical protein
MFGLRHIAPLWVRSSRKPDIPVQKERAVTDPRIQRDSAVDDRPTVERSSAVDDRPTIEHHRDDIVAPGATSATAMHTDTAPALHHESTVVREPNRARGGFSFGSVLSGVVVAFGAFIVLAALIGGIFAATGIADGGISTTEAANAGLGAAIGLVIAQFLAYMWGGYTAGRMARGSGVLNGLLVPIFAIILAALVGAVATALWTNAGGEPPDTTALPVPLSELSEIGTYAGIGALVAMLLGGALGGAMGARWHTKLEDHEREVALHQH